jgi:hypothetical protein
MIIDVVVYFVQIVDKDTPVQDVMVTVLFVKE